MFDTFDAFFKTRNMELHPESPVPLYYQLSRFLCQLIQYADYRPGDRFPTEELIAGYFHVSRPTANKAIQLLLDEGYLTRGKGLGTFVKENPFVEFTFLGQNLSFVDQLAKRTPIKSRVIWVKTVPATARASEQLGLKEGESTVYIRRLRYAYNRPLMVCDSQLPAVRFPGIERCEFVEDSLYKTLTARYDCPVVSSERYAVAMEAVEPEIIKLLEVAPFSSILTINGVSYTRNHNPVDRLKIFLRQGVALKTIVDTANPHVGSAEKTGLLVREH